MRIFGLKPMSTWDRMANIMKMMDDISLRTKVENVSISEISGITKKNSLNEAVKTDNLGKVYDIKA